MMVFLVMAATGGLLLGYGLGLLRRALGEPGTAELCRDAWRAGYSACLERAITDAAAVEERLRAGRRCRRCGCSDDDCRDCIARTGRPCYWVEDDLCSACVSPERLTVEWAGEGEGGGGP